MKNETAGKILGFSFLGILVFWLIKGVLFPTGYGMSVRYNMPGYYRTGSEHGFMTNYGTNSFSSSILQMLIFVFVIALFVSVVMFLKNNLFTREEITTLKGTFTSSTTQVTHACDQCGKDLNKEWKVCPYCGKEVVHSEGMKD